MKRRLTPQEKKAHSLVKDCRNIYGNNDKAARTGIRRKRARKHRKYRHNVNTAIATAMDHALQNPELIDDATSSIRRREWKKWPDAPLRNIIQYKLERRRRTGQAGPADATATC
jgi:hypothetical protein